MKEFLATLKGKIIVSVAAIVLVSTGVVATVVLTKDDSYRTIAVEELTGQIMITDGSNNLQDAYKGMHLESGDAVTVKEDSNMTLLLDMDKYVFADEGTKFWVEATGNSEKSNTKTKIHLEEGSVLCRLDSKLGDDEAYEVETPNSVMSVRGTIFRMSIYKDEKGENYTRIDVLEGAVKVDLHTEDGKKNGEGGTIEAGQSGLVHSNPEISEFVVGESDISYDDYSEPMSQFIVNTIDTGRELCIGKDLFTHYTNLGSHPEEGKVIKEPTCIEEGQREIYCSTCDMVVRTEPIEKTEHTEGEWEIQTEATCKEKGIEALICAVCGEVMETREVDYDGDHKFGEWTLDKSATCKEEGTEVRTCTVCGETEIRNVEKTDHSFGNWTVTVRATCEGAGKETRTCSVCGEVEEKTISAKGHSYGAWNDTIAATCTDEGTQTRTCASCGKNETRNISAKGHAFSGWTVVTEATCEDEGTQTRTCGVCGESEMGAITALGHDFPVHTASAWHNFNGPSDYSVGAPLEVFSYRYCTRCNVEEIYLEKGTILKSFGTDINDWSADCGYMG